MDSKPSFKLIGLKVLDGCAEDLRKVLRPGTMYYFCNHLFDPDGFNKEECAHPLADDFFIPDSADDMPLVNVSCIVGKNGDGKSSLVELYIRIINNFAYLAGFLSDHRDLRFVPRLFANLYYSVEDHICCISCNGEYAELLVDGVVVWARHLNDEELNAIHKNKIDLAKYSSVLFYTLVTNYSLYAYNSEEYKGETATQEEKESWIAALFHKNDSYQTPIVLSPMRTRGVIDVNREYSLSEQRLAELFLFYSDDRKYSIGENERVEGFAFRIENNSKLFDRTLKDYLTDKKQGARNNITFNVPYVQEKTALNLKNASVLNNNLLFWERFDVSFFDSGLLKYALSLLEDNQKGRKERTDLSRYLILLGRTTVLKRWEHARRNLELFSRNNGGALTFLQFQRLYLVFEVFKRWRQEIRDIEFRTLPPEEATVKDHLVWYLIYKTIRVIEYYPDYISGGIADYASPQHFFNERVRLNRVEKWFRALINDIETEKTHITLKIRQTIYYIKNPQIVSALCDHCSPPSAAKRIMEGGGFDYYVDCHRFRALIRGTSTPSEVLPPPVFTKEFLISRDDMELYPLSRMSSGERQLLNSAISIIYHLKNIKNSAPKAKKLVYNNVSIVLEEVELYFHPEYQRRFLLYLLEQIKNAHLSSRMAINLLFVTHSPFILSDIPRQNVLFLKDGRPDRSMQEDTFGANIHTLLQNGFFLNSVPIGDFAKSKINRMFSVLNSSKEILPEKYVWLEREIPLVSEPLIRGQLMKLFSQRRFFDQGGYSDRLIELENQVAQLKKQLNGHNREK